MDKKTIQRRVTVLGISYTSFMLLYMLSSSVIIFLVIFFGTFANTAAQGNMDSVPAFTLSTSTTMLINALAQYAVALPLFLLLLRISPKLPKPVYEPKKMSVGKFLIFIVMAFAVMWGFNILTMGLSALLTLVTGRGSDTSLVAGLVGNLSFWAKLLFAVIIPAFGEEFIFRYILRRHMGGSGDKIYIIFSGVIFGLFHGNLEQFFYAAALGMLLAWIYTATNKIWVPIALHAIVNFVGSIVASWATQSEIGNLIFSILLPVVILAGIVIFIVNLRKVRAGLAPPTEFGWLSKKEQALVPAPSMQVNASTGMPFAASNIPADGFGAPLEQSAQQPLPTPEHTDIPADMQDLSPTATSAKPLRGSLKICFANIAVIVYIVVCVALAVFTFIASTKVL